jgi:hypothetical protein
MTMFPEWQVILVTTIVGGALFYLVRHIIRELREASEGRCGSCGFGRGERPLRALGETKTKTANRLQLTTVTPPNDRAKTT